MIKKTYIKWQQEVIWLLLKLPHVCFGYIKKMISQKIGS